MSRKVEKVKVGLGLFLMWAFVIAMMIRVAGGYIKAIDPNPMVGQSEEIELYDPNVRRAQLSEYNHIEGLELLMEVDDSEANWTETGDGSTHDERSADGKTIAIAWEDHYTVRLRLKNTSSRDMRGVKLFASLPVTDEEEDGVVADELSLKLCLEHGESSAQMLRHFVGAEVPIRAGFYADGWHYTSDGETWYGDGYDASGWSTREVEFDIPAGEELCAELSLLVEPVYNLQVTTTMSPKSSNSKVWGSEFALVTLFGEKRQFHVVTEISNLDDVAQPINAWLVFFKNVKLVPGSMELDGESLADFELQEEYPGKQNFCPTYLKTNPPGETMVLEYDVEIGAGDGAALIDNHVGVRYMYVRAYAGCLYDRYPRYICWLLVVCLISVIAISVLCFSLRKGYQK